MEDRFKNPSRNLYPNEESYSTNTFSDLTVNSCVRTLKQLCEEDPLDIDAIIRVRISLARCLYGSRRLLDAEAELKHLIKLIEATQGTWNETRLRVLSLLETVLVDPEHPRQGHFEEGVKAIRSVRSRALADGQTANVTAMNILDMAQGHVLARQARFASGLDEMQRLRLSLESASYLQPLLTRLEKDGSWYLHEDILNILADLAMSYERIDARIALQTAKDLLQRRREQFTNRTVSFLIDSILLCARCHARTGELRESEHLIQEGIGRLELQSRTNFHAGRMLTHTQANLCQLLEYCGRLDEARDIALPKYEELKREKLIFPGCVPSFQPLRCGWLPPLTTQQLDSQKARWMAVTMSEMITQSHLPGVQR